MKTTAQQTLDDIVFEGLNKNYGAYSLRKSYSEHLGKALLTGALFFSLSLIAPVIYAELRPVEILEIAEPEVIVLENPSIDNKPKEIPKIELPPPPVVQQVATQRLVAMEPSPDEEVTEEPPAIEDLKGKVISSNTQDGVEADDNEVIEVGGDNSAERSVVDLPVREEPLLVAQQMPEFPGGKEAMMRFLSKNIRYPKEALRENAEGRVYVTFVVDKDGKISNIALLKGVGYGLDEEATRVIGKMPEWIPGKNNGRPVPVRFTLPVSFKISN